jgi:adenylate cyclase
MGKLADARTYLCEGIARYLPTQRSAPIYRAAQDPGVACRGYLGMAEWLLGYPERARTRIRESVKLAEELGDAYSLAYALCFPGAIVSETSGDDTNAVIEPGLHVAAERGFALWVAYGNVHRMSLRFLDEPSDLTLDRLRNCVIAITEIGVQIVTPYFMTLLSRAYQQAGRHEEALQVLDDARASGDARGEHWWQAEVERLRGEFLYARSAACAVDAEACMQGALDISRSQGAKSLELRAAMSLARLWRDQARTDDARDLLAPVYDWFTEGFDTADLKEAKALLDELASPPAMSEDVA